MNVVIKSEYSMLVAQAASEVFDPLITSEIYIEKNRILLLTLKL